VSRIGKKPIEIPSGVTVNIDGSMITVKGPKGVLERSILSGVSVEMEDGKVHVRRPADDRRSRSKQGLLRSLIANMVTGVDKGFERALEINGVGYKAELQGKSVVLYLGYSHKIEVAIPDQIEVQVEKATRVVVRGVDREVVGQVAAKIRALKKPDPYKAKGITYEGERILRKAGKKAIG
jgi:large subunit ribosomal protein L6